jgi:RNA polymerase sigma-70 factor (ECF subfamily)
MPLLLTRAAQRSFKSDGDLADRLRGGDLAAFSQLYETYYRSLVSYVRRCRFPIDEQDAQDIATNVFLKLLQNPSAFDSGRGHFKAWLFRVAGNEKIDEARRRRRITPPCEAPNSTVPPIEDESIAVHEALASLSVEHREVLQLRYLEGFSTKEAGYILNLLPITVASRCHEASVRLRRILGPKYMKKNGESNASSINKRTREFIRQHGLTGPGLEEGTKTNVPSRTGLPRTAEAACLPFSGGNYDD